MKKYNVAVVGATGIVGTEMLNVLFERDFPIENIYAVASEKSLGKQVEFGDEILLDVNSLEDFDFSKIDIVLASAGAQVSEKYIPKMVECGAIVIDNSSFYRTDKDIPLIIPEVNSKAIVNYVNKGIIANPNCSTIQMLLVLAPLHKKYKIRRVVVSTYQSVSGAGLDASDELFNQTRDVYSNNSTELSRKVFTKQIAFNVIPHIDVFLDSGDTKEEWKMSFETKKILDPEIEVSATCVRVPVFVGHSEAVNIEFEEDVSEEEIRETLKDAAGVSVVDYRANEGYVTPVEAAGEDNVFVSRIRKDTTLENTFNMWIVGDNLRKGAALNAVQIAEELINFLNKQ